MYDLSRWEDLVMNINRQIMKFESLPGDHSKDIAELKESRKEALKAIKLLKQHV